MKRKYLFCRDFDSIGRDGVYFVLWVGKSRRDQNCLAVMKCFADDLGYHLCKWSDGISLRLIQRAIELYPDSRVPLMHLRRGDFDIMDFYKRINESNIEYIEEAVKMSPTSFVNMSTLDLSYFRAHVREGLKKSALSVKRKNLISEKVSENKSVAINFGLILALILLDALMCNLFPVLQ